MKEALSVTMSRARFCLNSLASIAKVFGSHMPRNQHRPLDSNVLLSQPHAEAKQQGDSSTGNAACRRLGSTTIQPKPPAQPMRMSCRMAKPHVSAKYDVCCCCPASRGPQPLMSLGISLYVSTTPTWSKLRK